MEKNPFNIPIVVVVETPQVCGVNGQAYETLELRVVCKSVPFREIVPKYALVDEA